jgi:putative transposase
MSHKKQSYHPAIILCYYLKLLPNELLIQIPTSTLYDWSTKEHGYSFGEEWYEHNKSLFNTITQALKIQQLLKKNQLLIKLLALNRFIASNKSAIRFCENKVSAFLVKKIECLKQQVPFTQLLKAIGISAKTYYQLTKQKCSKTLSHNCPLKHPHQLLKDELTLIKEVVESNDFNRNSIASFYYRLKRKADASYSLGTFYKYWHKLGLHTFQRLRKAKQRIGIRSNASLKLIHLDVTKYKLLDGTWAFIYVVKDNFSRMLLEVKAYQQLNAIHTEEVLQLVIENYFANNYLLKQVMTDGGSENKTLKKYIVNYSIQNLEHIVAQVDVNYSNSMVEAGNKALKYYGLHLEKITSFEQLENLLPALKTQLNNSMMTVLNGLTPQEVFENETYETIYGNIEQKISKQERLKRNKNTNCCKLLNEL